MDRAYVVLRVFLLIIPYGKYYMIGEQVKTCSKYYNIAGAILLLLPPFASSLATLATLALQGGKWGGLGGKAALLPAPPQA